jgi:hypothetical protein
VHDGGRWLVLFEAGLFVTVGGCRRPMMDGRGTLGARGLLDRFVPNPARPSCRRPLAAQREYVAVRSVHLLRGHCQTVSQVAAGELVSSYGPALSGHSLASARLPAVVPGPTSEGLAKPPGGPGPSRARPGAVSPVGADVSGHDPSHVPRSRPSLSRGRGCGPAPAEATRASRRSASD